MKTQGEIEAAISEGISRFEQEYMGRGPKDIHAHLLGDFLIVRLQGVLTAAEQHLVKSLPSDKGRDLLKQVRTQLVETARPVLEATVQAVTGIKVISLHHDISTTTGEEVLIFTLIESAPFRETKKKSSKWDGCMSVENDDLSPLGKQLLLATAPFAREFRSRSWWAAASTLVILGGVLTGAALIPWWPARLAASIIGGLVMVRAFCIFHDFMHGSLLQGSRLARCGFYLFGLLLLAPPRYWRFSHNFHHAHVGKPVKDKNSSIPLMTSDVGTFPLMTTAMWREASTWQRLRYRFIRHPLTILGASVTVFFFSICLLPLLQNPRRYWDGSLALLAHGGVIAVLWIHAGLAGAFFAFTLPFMIAAALGAYLFYAQHNFADTRIVPGEEWTYYRGALQSSSYMKLGPIMKWFTANIGYHHIHHLNSHIPFYRLPEAMASIPELQCPPMTTLHPRDILACLRLNLWDQEKQRLVTYRDAGRLG